VKASDLLRTLSLGGAPVDSGHEDFVVYDSDGEIDDVAISNVEMGRLERMSDGHVWGCFYVDGKRFSFNILARKKHLLTVQGQWEEL
jgi:hypothetical protein